MKSISITKEVYRSFVIEKVLPAVVFSWPAYPNVTIQHDNARAHVTPDDKALRRTFDAYKNRGWSFTLRPQPPNSPDTNILDLGFFAAIQSLQNKKSASNIQELVDNVLRAFDDLLGRNLEGLLRQQLQGAPLVKGEVDTQAVNVVCPEDVYGAAKASLDAIDVAAMEEPIEEELREARAVNELAQELESMDLFDDMADALDALGIEAISVDDE
ncbi:Aste57867_2699 [Aphanomyces stellatus]|uniref:Aste57867_2699 protein n=1 Tax=Aphanomyces stellatus TaxID=120398 RepID=A0A485KDC2_9STRA|nr:hypothetical protein As57867_002692 [Aphanomyces stellatus]VFT79892.1 Aste57867_2699 [Aphanomyces stellatus]